jgi:hypothetical protein
MQTPRRKRIGTPKAKMESLTEGLLAQYVKKKKETRRSNQGE